MWGGNNSNSLDPLNKLKNLNVKYKPSVKKKNRANMHIRNKISSQDNKLLKSGAFYLPNFFEKTLDRTTFDKLKEELENCKDCEKIPWSKHFKYENPTFSETFNEIIDKMAKHFNVKVMHTRLNYYPDNSTYKPMHKDKNAYSSKRGNFTMGASFGSTRELKFICDETKESFSFPQNNGDIFSFNKKVNEKFMHGVPKTFNKVGERFSIIAWGDKND